MKVTRALISVSDKTGIVDFARALLPLGIEILSTGGTAQLLKLNGVVVTELGSKVDPDADKVFLAGKRLLVERPVYLMLNKPRGYVTTMSDLVRLAERYDRLILHESRGGTHVYLFEAEGIIYRYSTQDLHRSSGSPDDPAEADVVDPAAVVLNA